jgi:hypothetical protein
MVKSRQQIIDWLLAGDVSIQYQVWRDLLGTENKELQERIASEGWGHAFLLRRKADGHWGDRFYQPKWISTHYTLLDLRSLCLSADNEAVQKTIEIVLKEGKADDGGIQLGPSTAHRSDLCVNGMFLNYASYFKTPETELHSIVDCILDETMPDKGFNCRTTRSGATHSSLHTTISVLEGLSEFQKTGSRYRETEIQNSIHGAIGFILLHRLFLSERTGKIINTDYLKLTFPCRWKYDILRALDYLQSIGIEGNASLKDAIAVLLDKKNKDGTWNMQAAHPGAVHFVMEKAGKPSRWNTLRAMRVLDHFSSDNYLQG